MDQDPQKDLRYFSKRSRLPPGHRLLGFKNVIVSPHAIAWTEEFFRDTSHFACRAVLEVSRGRPPADVVNREVLTRSGCRAKLARFK